MKIPGESNQTEMSEFKTVAANENTEEKLRAEIEELKRRLQESHPAGASARRRRPSAASLWILAALVVAAVVVAAVVGYVPQSIRQTALAKEAQENGVADPLVNIAIVQRSPGKSGSPHSGPRQRLYQEALRRYRRSSEGRRPAR
jgi:hypothetical protein